MNLQKSFDRSLQRGKMNSSSWANLNVRLSESEIDTAHSEERLLLKAPTLPYM